MNLSVANHRPLHHSDAARFAFYQPWNASTIRRLTPWPDWRYIKQRLYAYRKSQQEDLTSRQLRVLNGLVREELG